MDLKVLIVDDELGYLSEVAQYLNKKGISTCCSSTGEVAISDVINTNPDVVLINSELPDTSGIEICKQLNANKYPGVILVTSEKETEQIFLDTYHAGGIGVVNRNESVNVLYHKILALGRRLDKDYVQVGSTFYYYGNLSLSDNERARALPRIEYLLLKMFVGSGGKVITRKRIMTSIWEHQEESSRNIDMYIYKLRSIIGKGKIITITGVGYKYQPDELKACC